MVVEEFHVDFAEEEDALLSLPEKWFTKLVDQRDGRSFVEALQIVANRTNEATQESRRKSRAKPSRKDKKSYRLDRLIVSILREDKSKPPLCIFCFDDSADVHDLCGRLLWGPDKPTFFAAHELCTLMVPEILTLDAPSPLGKKLFDTDLKQLNESYARGRALSCHVCGERGALVGCCSTQCRHVFHLPCAIRSKCFIDYEEFRCFCEKHSGSAYDSICKNYLSRPRSINNDSSDLCCLCMERVEQRAKMHSVVQLECCGFRFYHYECLKNATLIRGQEMRCPACNRPNEETSFEETIKRQGIYFQTYNPSCDSTDESSSDNVRSRCYYAMTRTAAKDRTCLSSLGPDRYDDSDALNDQVYNAFEALNGCITCGVHCHRLCAGPPWSTYCPDGDGAEEKWQCDDCREAFLPVENPPAPPKASETSQRNPVPVVARRNRTHTSNCKKRPPKEGRLSLDENNVTRQKRGRDDATVRTSEPPKKQTVLSNWCSFTKDRHRTNSSGSDIQVL